MEEAPPAQPPAVAAPDEEPVVAEPVADGAGPSEAGAGEEEAVDVLAGTVTVTRGKRSRRTPLTAFHGLVQAAASDRLPGDDSDEDEDEEDDNAGRAPRSQVHGWGDVEDATLAALVAAQTGPGPPRWAEIAARMPGRRGKQCRDRYVNHLAPNISRAEWTDAEERVLAEGYLSLGAKWAALARLLPGRTENMVKNHWHATLRCKGATRGSAPRFLKAFQLSVGLGCPMTGGAAAAAAVAELTSPAGDAAAALLTASAAQPRGAEGGGGGGAPSSTAAAVSAVRRAAATWMHPPAVATLTTADALVSLAAASHGGGDGAASSPDHHGFAPAAPPPAKRPRAAQPQPQQHRGSVASGGAARGASSGADNRGASAAANPSEAAGFEDTGRDFICVSNAPLRLEDVLRRVRCAGGPELSSFMSTSACAAWLSCAPPPGYVDGAAAAAAAAAAVHARWPVSRVALAVRTGAAAPGDVTLAVAVAAPDWETATKAVAFASAALKALQRVTPAPELGAPSVRAVLPLPPPAPAAPALPAPPQTLVLEQAATPVTSPVSSPSHAQPEDVHALFSLGPEQQQPQQQQHAVPA